MFDFAGLSEIGPVREDNQDSFYLPDTSATLEAGPIFAMADGMGGYAQGGLASSLALKALLAAYQQNLNGKPAGALKKGVEAANNAVCAEANRMGVSRMGTTLTAAAMHGSTLTIAHVGDSRAYLVRDGKALSLTQDHTVVGDLLRMKVIKPEQVRTHARRSILTRAIGLALFVQPDIFTVELKADDRLVLCSDGCWGVLEDDDFATLTSRAANAEAICQALVGAALDHGSDDNVSVVAVHVRKLAETPHNGKIKQSWLSRLLGTL